ncbi:Hypothetical predicted protein [Mytilus galloprovincialis]|uniref:B box-type domain-containing protein n=1 Tax=Mytilus galloprovincialis TaxID=29158 RepID=A0A8B6DFA9_MYTGA|nr:Hypothetical predicted protein [Mytilus galloprovincialis]
MASSDMRFCTLCYDDGTSEEAVTWCTECEVFLCVDCEKHHKKSRTSKDHKTISTKDWVKLPKFIQEINSQCSDHKKTFELYCPVHACPCCVLCVIDKHKKCQEMKPLSDILKQIKASASVQLFDKDLKDLKENFEEMIKCLNSRINSNDDQKLKAAEKIRSFKKSIDEFLIKIEEEILSDLETKHSKLNSEMNTLIQKLEQRANQISQVQGEFTEMKRLATELQMYVGLKEIENTTAQATKYIEDLKNDKIFDEKTLEVTISSSLQSIFQDVKSYGVVNISSGQSTLQIKTGRKDQAQYLAPSVPGVKDIKPSLLRILTIPEDMKSACFVACRILPCGNYLILDSSSSHLLPFSNDGMFMKKVVTFFGTSYDACFVRNDTVAVTLGLTNKTVLVDIEKNEIIESIKLSHFCSGVASDGQLLVISSSSKKTIVNLNDLSHTIIEGIEAGYVALFKGNIYGTNLVNQVCCFKSTGESLWTFQHDDIIHPRGITLDKNGLVYIASSGNNRIVVVSPDGKTCKTILSEADGIKNPLAIDINRETGMLIVSSERDEGENSYDSAIVYKILNVFLKENK